MSKNKKVDIKNKEVEIKKIMAILIKKENAKYLNDKSDNGLKQKINTLKCLSKYPKIIEEVWRNYTFFQTINIFHNCHFLYKFYNEFIILYIYIYHHHYHLKFFNSIDQLFS